MPLIPKCLRLWSFVNKFFDQIRPTTKGTNNKQKGNFMYL